MTDKKMIWIGIVVGSTLGGMIPSLWHASMFSLWGLFFSTLGGLAGIWLGWKLSRG
jgi:hypothetical protein